MPKPVVVCYQATREPPAQSVWLVVGEEAPIFVGTVKPAKDGLWTAAPRAARPGKEPLVGLPNRTKAATAMMIASGWFAPRDVESA